MRMLDFTKAFPGKVNTDQYLPLIEAAKQAAKGTDGLPRVVAEDYPTYKDATRAANAIRNHVRIHNLELAVSCPENGKSVFVWKAKPRKRTNKKKDAVEPDAKPNGDESGQGQPAGHPA